MSVSKFDMQFKNKFKYIPDLAIILGIMLLAASTVPIRGKTVFERNAASELAELRFKATGLVAIGADILLRRYLKGR